MNLFFSQVLSHYQEFHYYRNCSWYSIKLKTTQGTTLYGVQTCPFTRDKNHQIDHIQDYSTRQGSSGCHRIISMITFVINIEYFDHSKE